MNLYFIVEGKRTEKKVYPEWLQHLIPKLIQVKWAYEAKENNYYLFNGNGFPSLLYNHLKNSIDEVNELGIFNYLILILDVDESSFQERIQEVNTFIEFNKISLQNCELIIIPQNRCIETWFLGNKSIFKKNPDSPELSRYINFYNVKLDDPEHMGKFHGFNTHSQFHSMYCKLFLNERNIQYTKSNPRGVTELSYLNCLINRTNESNHLKSLKYFFDFCFKINSELE